MKIADTVTALALAILLTWLLVRGLGPSDPDTQAALLAIEHYSATEKALQRDVLKARSGLLRNYDAIVAHGAAMRRDLEAVRNHLEDENSARLLASVEGNLREQEELVERFKSGNALLHNSLSYFALFSGRVTRAPSHDQLVRATESLTGEMLHLTLDTSEAATERVGDELETVAAHCARGVCPDDVRGLVAHGRLLHVLLPQVDRTLAALIDGGRDASTEQLREHLVARERSVETASIRFRFLLYGTSLLFLILLLKGEVRVRARARDLRRQVALEHAVAGFSATLIGGGPGTRARVGEGLAQLAEALGAQRAYYYSDRSARFCCWPSGADEIDASPPLHLARRLGGAGPAIVHLQLGDKSVGPVEISLLRKLDIAAWIGVLRCSAGRLDSFLGFEFETGARRRLPRQVTVLRTALDAICLAFEHEEAEAARQCLAEQLSHARRMETIGAFASGIAHNFNNLIGAISGYAEMAHAGLPRGGQVRQHLEQIQHAADRGRSLIDGLLDFGRRRAQRREPVDINALVAETRDMIAATLGDAHMVTVRDCPRRPFSLIDPAQVQQALLNLCRNAVESMQEGGEVAIEIEACELHRPLAHPHGSIPSGRQIRIGVRDSGHGIAPENLRRLFEPFHTTKPSGNGLGLATAREVIVGFGGAITIDSEVGRGTEARIWLPELPASASIPVPAPGQPECSRGTGEQILLLVQEPERRLRMEELIAALGYEPIGVGTPARLLGLLEGDERKIDALFLCVPEITPASGELLRQIRAHSDAPCILATGSAERLEAGCLAQAGVSAILACPPRPSELSAALRRSLDQRVNAVALSTQSF